MVMHVKRPPKPERWQSYLKGNECGDLAFWEGERHKAQDAVNRANRKIKHWRDLGSERYRAANAPKFELKECGREIECRVSPDLDPQHGWR